MCLRGLSSRGGNDRILIPTTTGDIALGVDAGRPAVTSSPNDTSMPTLTSVTSIWDGVMTDGLPPPSNTDVTSRPIRGDSRSQAENCNTANVFEL